MDGEVVETGTWVALVVKGVLDRCARLVVGGIRRGSKSHVAESLVDPTIHTLSSKAYHAGGEGLPQHDTVRTGLDGDWSSRVEAA